MGRTSCRTLAAAFALLCVTSVAEAKLAELLVNDGTVIKPIALEKADVTAHVD